MYIVHLLEDLQYSCGSSLEDIDVYIESPLNLVKMLKNLVCDIQMEIPYFGANHKDICIYCANDETIIVDREFYPICKTGTNSTKKSFRNVVGRIDFDFKDLKI